jgi:hypothetical protein
VTSLDLLEMAMLEDPMLNTILMVAERGFRIPLMVVVVVPEELGAMELQTLQQPPVEMAELGFQLHQVALPGLAVLVAAEQH